MNSSFSSNLELQRSLDELHPFHFVLDQKLHIVHSGRLLRRILGEQIDGRPFQDIFVVADPREFSTAASWDDYDDMFLNAINAELTLRGKCLTLAGSRCFVGSPWFMQDLTGKIELTPTMALAHERWGEQLMAIQLFRQQRHDIAIFRDKLSRRNRERDVLQASLMEEKARLQTVLAAATDSIINIDSTGIIVSVNPAVTRLFGYSAEEMIGQNVTLLMPEDIAREHDGHIQRYIKTGERHVIGIGREVRALRKDGTYFPCELSLGELKLGESIFFTGILRNITDRKIAEERRAESLVALQKSHDDLGRVLNQLQLVVIAVDARGRITFASESSSVIRANPLGARWEEVLPITDETLEKIHAALSKPEHERRHLELVSGRDADRRWIELEIRDDPRDSGCHIFYLYDVTDLHRLKQQLTGQRSGQIVGDSAVMHDLYAAISQVAQGEWTVLIEGETGTGKELVARAIHNASERRKGPFIAANCAGLTESILGSELFGHVKGAFTGAISDRQGLFEAAVDGTLFLDEIGDVAAPVQAALLRAVQEKEITRLGETRPRKVDVRIVTATNRSLPQLVEEGKFREDLLYRLRSARVRTPPLRERLEDIPLLVAAFLAEERVTAGKLVTGVSNEAMRQLARYDWPGNVRELRSAIEHAVVHCRGNRIEINDLPPELLAAVPASRPIADARPAGTERDRIIAVLQRTGGNRARAARFLGIGRATLYRRLDELGINSRESRDSA
jgi:PAS domain S-box-containing protein